MRWKWAMLKEKEGDERNNNSKKCEHAKPLNCALESPAPFDKSWLGLAHLLSSYHIIIITVQQTSLTSYVTLMAWLRNFRRSPVAGVFWYLPETRSTGKLYIPLLWFFFFVLCWDHVWNLCTFCILMLGKFNEFCGFERPWRHTI